MATIRIEDLTKTQISLITELKRRDKVSVKLSRNLFEKRLDQTLQNRVIYLNSTKNNSDTSLDKIVGVYCGKVTKYYNHMAQQYIFVMSKENKIVYGIPLVFVKDYKKL